jgi:uncharacterized protein (UPF0332 family)
MSPRSEELLAVAWERLQAAGALLERELWGPDVGDAYYAILYAARSALSERDRNAKTHRGIWAIFSEKFVASRDIDAELARD